jgi:hypothetical protein
MTSPLLPITGMAERHWALTPAQAEHWLEAVRVCLDRHHVSPQDFDVLDDDHESTAHVQWVPADQRCRDALNNQDDTTEIGAYVCAIAAAELLRGLFAVRRAETHTGADYYLAPRGASMDDLEDCYRLEISGTDGDLGEVRRRVPIKINQARNGKSNLPALAGIVGFRVKRIIMKTVLEQT